jgi:hypothetical protein
MPSPSNEPFHPTLIEEDDGALAVARQMLSIWQERYGGDDSIADGAVHPHILDSAVIYPTAISALMDGWLQVSKGVNL